MERDGYLAIRDALYETIEEDDPSVLLSAKVILEYGKTRGGYWNNELFLEQMQVAVKVAEAKYPPWKFNHVSGFSTTLVGTVHLHLMLLSPFD